MAESIRGLYLRLGLDYDELNQGFVQATRTLKSNMQALSRENTIIRLTAEADLSNVEDADQRLAIQTEALNRQLEVQRNRLRLATASWTSVARAEGEGSDNAQRARIQVERERIALSRMERELRNLNETQDETTAGTQNLTEAFSSIAGKFAGPIAAFVAVKEGLSALSETAKGAVENFRELSKQSYELDLPISKTKDYLQRMRLAGGDIGDYEGFIRGVQSALATGDNGDREYVALQKYGLNPFDQNGNIKNFEELDELIQQGYEKAKALGEQIAYLLDLGGDAGVRDAKQYLDRIQEAKADQAKLSKIDMNYEELHQLDRELNLVTEQTDEFYNALSNAFSPMARMAIQGTFELFRNGTDWIKDSTDEIRKLGFAMQVASEKVNNFFVEHTGNDFLESFGKAFAKVNPLKNFVGSTKRIGGYFFDDVFDEADQRLQEYKKTVEETGKAIDNTIGGSGKALNGVADARLKSYLEELSSLQIELQFGDDDFAKANAELDAWHEKVLSQHSISEEERAVITDLYAAKREKIEKEYNEKILKENEETQNRIKEITQQAEDTEFALTHTAFEKQLHDIERWKEEQMEKADTAEEVAAIIRGAAAKEAEAYEQEVERIKGATQSLEDEIFAMENSQFEVDKRRAMQRAQQALDEGVDAETVNRYLADKFAELDKKAAENKEYTQAPNGGSGRSKYIDLDKPAQPSIGLFADEDKIRARLKSPASQQVKDVQSLLQPAESDIEIIKGLQSSLKSAVKFEPQVVGQIQLPVEQFQNAIATTLARQMQNQPAPVTVSPTINISVDGNVVADQKFVDDLAEKISDKTYNSITSAVENATKNNYSYAN